MRYAMRSNPGTTMVLLTEFRKAASRYICPCPRSPLSALHFSTIRTPLKDEPPSCSINESQILNQLADLLPIRTHPSIHRPISENPKKTQEFLPSSISVAGFLQPEEKLRGVFLQKRIGKSAIEQALSSVGVELTLDLLAKVVNRGNLGADSMVLFFSWAIKQPSVANDVRAYDVIIKALGRRKFFKNMMEMWEKMRDEKVQPNSDTLFIVLDSYVQAGRVSKAIEMFRALEDYGLKCDTERLNVLLRCLCKRSRVGAASSFMNKIGERVSFDVTTYNVIIGGWARFGKVAEDEKTLEAMVEDGYEPDCSTYSYVIEGLGRAGKIEGAISVFEELERGGSELSADVYNAMMSNFVSVGDIDEGLKYYQKMVRQKCDPNMKTYVILISAFLKVRRVSDAIEMFDEMLGRGIVPTTGTVTSFTETLCSYGPPHAALTIYKKARKAGCRISPTAYKLLLMRLSRFGKCGMLLDIWDDMHECGYSADVQSYEYVINGLSSIGQLESAISVMEEALRKGFFPSKLTCSKLNNKLLSSNKIEIAYKLLLKMKAARASENAERYWRAKGWHF